MKRWLLIFAILAMLLTAACQSNLTEAVPELDYDYFTEEYQPEPEPELPAEEPDPARPAEPLAQDDEMWLRFGNMTFGDMRQSIMEYGAAAFEDATGRHIVFDNPDNILSIRDPIVMAKGSSRERQGFGFIYVLFSYRHCNDGNHWRVDGYSHGNRWNMQPQMSRGRREGRRYIDADTVDVRIYTPVDWGGGATSQYTHVSISGENFAEEFIALVGMLDMWFIGDNRLYVNFCSGILDVQGSAMVTAAMVSRYRTLFSIPGVEEIVILVEGQTEQGGDFMIPPITRRDEPHIQRWLESP